MAKATKSALDKLLDEITPLEQAMTDAKMMIAVRITDAMQAKQWKNKDLLKAVGRDNPSVITKWLSGTHNFTTETLVEIESALGISLLNLEEKSTEKLVIQYSLSIQSEVKVSMAKSYKPQHNTFIGARDGVTVKSFDAKYILPES
jgi:ribosome-binding protein aMBF1 (putative translation factor)